MPLDRYNIAEEIANAHIMLDQLTTGRNPLFKKIGDIHWAYHSAVDNTPQPYRLFIPSKYDPQKKAPLIVALHGMGGNENSFFDGYNKGSIKEEAEKRGYLIVCPKGRGPADMYLGNAQKDVFDALERLAYGETQSQFLPFSGGSGRQCQCTRFVAVPDCDARAQA